MEELQIPVHGTIDYIIMREVCQAVSLRSASIVAAGEFLYNKKTVFLSFRSQFVIKFLAISALMKLTNRQKMKVGVGGALIQYHPTYHDLLLMQVNELAPANVTEVNFFNIGFLVSKT